MKNKLLSIGLIIFGVIFILSTLVYAESSFTVIMTPSESTIEEGREFTVTVKISNLNVDNGINSLSGVLEYDTAVFEEISESSIEGLNNWDIKYDDASGKVELTKNTFATSTQDVFQITFKTKSSISKKSGEISYKDIVASNSEEDIEATDISTSINIGSGSSDNTNTNTNTNTITANTTIAANTATNNTSANTNTNVVSSYVNTIQNTTVEDNMPKTGVDDTIMAIMFVLVAMGIFFYVRIERINREMR